MAIVNTIEIDGRPVRFKASAMIPRMYRIKFRRDIFKDLDMLMKGIESSSESESLLDTFSLEIFENIAYMMAKYGDPEGVPETTEEWLDGFNTFSIYRVLPEMLKLWGMNVETREESKKNEERPTGR